MGVHDRELHQSLHSIFVWTPREKRYAVAALTTITLPDGTSASAYILNLSNKGCRITTPFRLRPVERLKLLVEPHGMVEAEVRWTNNSDAGLRLVSREPFYEDYQFSYPP